MNEDDNPIKQNPIQKWIWSCWLDYCKKIPKGSWGVINGEAVQGTNTKDSRLVAYKESDQIQIALEILAPFIQRCSYVWFTFGTEWHEFAGGKLAVAVYEAIKSEFKHTKIFKPQYEIWLGWNGKRVHFTHHRTTASAPSSKATPLNRSMIDMLVEAPARHGLYPDIVVRSHAHDPGTLQNAWGTSIGLASWQIKGAYAWKKVPAAAEVIGACILELDRRNEVHPWQVLYKIEKPIMFRPNRK